MWYLQKEIKFTSLLQIIFPTGTYVKVSIYNYGSSSWYINLEAYPTVVDVGKTSGLCGVLDDDMTNDLRRRDGTQDNINSFSYYNPPDDFSRSWQLVYINFSFSTTIIVVTCFTRTRNQRIVKYYYNVQLKSCFNIDDFIGNILSRGEKKPSSQIKNSFKTFYRILVVYKLFNRFTITFFFRKELES